MLKVRLNDRPEWVFEGATTKEGEDGSVDIPNYDQLYYDGTNSD